MDDYAPHVGLHARVMTTLMDRFDTNVMNNVYRGDYVECMIALTLGTGWHLTWRRGWDWAPWDCEHTSGARLEIKQSAARQSWDSEPIAETRYPRFDIALRTGYSTRDGSQWINTPGRQADLYVFAWHGERQHEIADHRDPNQWLFFVVAEQDLPDNQKHIGLQGLRAIVSPCRIAGLKSAVDDACPGREALKASTASRCDSLSQRIS